MAVLTRLRARLLGQQALGCSVDGKMVLIEAVEGSDTAIGEESPAADAHTLLTRAFE